MSRAVALRSDYSADELRELAVASDDANQARRLLALAAVQDGFSRSEAARLNAMDGQTLRDWVLAFNEHGPQGLFNTRPPGRPPKLTPEQKQAVAELVEAGPDPEVDGVVRWRCVDIKAIIEARYGIELNEATVGRLLKELGFAHVSARPRHPRQAPGAIETFKKKPPGTTQRTK